MARLVRTALLVAVAAVALLGIGSADTSAAARPTIAFVSPSPEEGAELTSDSVAFEFTYDRKPQATRTLVCSLAGPTSSIAPCDAPVTAGAKGSQSGTSYSGLANGLYTFTVSLTLSDGGTATATLHFSSGPIRHLYWTNYTTIGRAKLDGTGANQSFITGAGSPRGVAVDADHVYWTNYDTSTIGRANLDGTGVDQSFTTGAFQPRAVAVDADHVYWTSSTTDTIGRANLDGTSANQFFITGAAFPGAVAVDADHVYWTNNATGTIGRANLGRAPTRASSPAPNPSGWRSTPTTSTGPTAAPARSAGRTWTGRAPTRASSPAPDPSGWRSTPTTSTGPTSPPVRSAWRTWMGRAPTRACSPAPPSPLGWRSTATRCPAYRGCERLR